MNTAKVAITATLALLLTSCAWHPYKTAPGTSVVVSRVPDALTAEVPEPRPKGTTNGDLAEWADALKEALKVANDRLRAIRDL